MFNAVQPWHLIVLVVVLLLLFGSKRLPDAARGVGRSLRIFKSEMKEMQKDDPEDEGAREVQRELPAAADEAKSSAKTSDDVKKSA